MGKFIDRVIFYTTFLTMVNLIVGAVLTNKIDIDLPQPVVVYYCYAKNVFVMCLGGAYTQLAISGNRRDWSTAHYVLLWLYTIFGVVGTLPIVFIFANNNFSYIIEKGDTNYYAFYMMNYILAMKDMAFMAIYFLYKIAHVDRNINVRVSPLPTVQPPPVAAMPDRVFKEEGECAICYVGEPDKVLGCGHTMCAGCVNKMTSISQCPFCRSRLSVVVSTNE